MCYTILTMKSVIKKSGFVLGIAAILIGTGTTVSTAHAETSESTINQQIATFQSQLNDELTQANDIYAKLSDSKTQLVDTQNKLANLKVQIASDKASYASLKANVANQMRAMQASGGNSMSFINILTNSSNLTEMIQRLTNLNMVRSAQNKQAESLVNTQKTLTEMQKSLEATEENLTITQANYQTQASSLQGNISDLQTQISNNQNVLKEMQAQAAAKAAADKAAAQKAQEEQAEAKSSSEAVQKAQAAQTSSASTSSSSSSSTTMESSSAQPVQSSSETVQSSSAAATTTTSSSSEAETPATPDTTSGKTLTVEATAYALNGTTAMGIDLSKSPMCIAVDPSVIPLGSMVEVPGYGIAIAGDTGGAIIGNHIDVHFSSEAQAIQWGSQTLTIKVLS